MSERLSGNIESQNNSVRVLTDISNLPKYLAQWDIGVTQYKLSQYGKRYIFKKDGTVGIFNPKTNRYEKTNRAAVEEEIRAKRKIIEQGKGELSNLKPQIKPQTKSKDIQYIPKENKEIVVSDEALFDGLRGLIRKGDQKKIDAHLNRNQAQYLNLVRSPAFQEKLKKARENPKDYALILQLYERFVVGNTSIVIDGKYGKNTSKINVNVSDISTPEVATIDKNSNAQQSTETATKNGFQNFQKTSESFVSALKPQYNTECANIFTLPESIVNSLISPEERLNKTPAQIDVLYKQKQNMLFEKGKSSAMKGCLRYLQQLFQQPIEVSGSPDLEKMFQNFDPASDENIHEQNIDFKVTLNGRPFSISYNVLEGELKYTPLVLMDPVSGNLLRGKDGLSAPLIKKAQIPSLYSKLRDTKKSVISAAQQKDNNESSINKAISDIETPLPDVPATKEVAKIVAKESCMQTFLELTGYNLPQDLAKQTYSNTQIYMLYDMFNRTIDAQYTAFDIYDIKNLLIQVRSMVADYADPAKIAIKNKRSEQFSPAFLVKQNKRILEPDNQTDVNQSLPFYNFFSQYIDPQIKDPENDKYRIFDIKKLKADMDAYPKKKYFDDKKLVNIYVASVEQKEKQDAEKLFDKI